MMTESTGFGFMEAGVWLFNTTKRVHIDVVVYFMNNRLKTTDVAVISMVSHTCSISINDRCVNKEQRYIGGGGAWNRGVIIQYWEE